MAEIVYLNSSKPEPEPTMDPVTEAWLRLSKIKCEIEVAMAVVRGCMASAQIELDKVVRKLPPKDD